MNEPLLSVQHLTVSYTSRGAETHALSDISFSIGRGETLGIVGETGAGKTTTALSIMRLLPEHSSKIKSGEIVFDGMQLLKAGSGENAAEKTMLTEDSMQQIRGAKISMIFQDSMTSLNPVKTVGSQIEEALYLHNTENKSGAELKEQTDEMLRLVGIDPARKNEYPHQFSGGMKQRVSIAMALACSPELLIADEPTSALDVTIQAQVLAMMAALKEKFQMSLIMITHDLGIIAKTCDYVAVMYSGEIVEYGAFEDIYMSSAHHPYTDGLFGAIPDIYSDIPRLKPIKGLPPDPTDLPKGCRFNPRCEFATEICRSEEPPACRTGTHVIKCHRFSEEKQNG